MGQTSSSTSVSDRSTRSDSLGIHRRLSFRSSFKRHRFPRPMIKTQRQFKNRGRDLSAAFNMITDDFNVELININEATEEQLMTLPGIGRRTAQNIVDYRRAIGQFRKVEDLAIVSGVGAAKLASIRSEISVTSRRSRLTNTESNVTPQTIVRSASCGTPTENSTLGTLGMLEVNGLKPSPSSVNFNRSNDRNSQSSISQTSVGLVDLNTASMFQLMSVRGINQAMAASIVHYREKKGRFRSVEDLAKVRGFNGRLMNEYKPNLTVTSTTADQINELKLRNGCLPRRLTHRRSSSVPVTPTLHNISTGDIIDVNTVLRRDVSDVDFSLTTATNKEIYELLAAKSPRPSIVDRFTFKRNGKPALRLATWNLDWFDDDKSSNLGIIEVICLTILESGVSLVALQEVANRKVLEKICNELNNPSLKKIQEFVGSRGDWECLVSTSEPPEPEIDFVHHLGFIFDTNQGIEVLRSETLDWTPTTKNVIKSDVGADTSPAAFSATFKMETFVISLLCVYLGLNHINVAQTKDQNGAKSIMTTVLNSWQQKNKGVNLRIVLGDFKYDPLSKELKILRDNHFTNLMPSNTDNIWMNHSVQKHFTSYCDVVKTGLSHLAIPKGKWNLGGSVSSHCPIWAEFYVDQIPPTLVPIKNIQDENEVDEKTKSMKVMALRPNGSVPTTNGNHVKCNSLL